MLKYVTLRPRYFSNLSSLWVAKIYEVYAYIRSDETPMYANVKSGNVHIL